MEANRISLRMNLANLNSIPDCRLPPGYHIHWYQSGDEERWAQIVAACENSSIEHARRQFRAEFGADRALLSERQCFLLDSRDCSIATTTAWFDITRHQQPQPGRIHWVMMTPAFQGRGLAKPLLASACRRLQELGHQTAELVTDSLRLPAINLYLKFGFVPMPQGEADAEFWRHLQNEPIVRQKSPA